MFEKGKEDLIEYCFAVMISKDNRSAILNNLGITARLKSKSAKAAAKMLRDSPDFTIRVNPLTKEMRKAWTPLHKDRHKKHLLSGSLKGHHWHGARPSNLHLSLQNKVRDVSCGKLDMKEFLAQGSNIIRHEYFMTATHDLLEIALVEEFNNSMPSLAHRSVTDFIFKNIPYDLKAGTLASKWTIDEVKKNPRAYAQAMMDGADKERTRKQAANSINGWALNRFYVLVRNDSLWLSNPDLVLKKFITACKKLGSPMQIKADGRKALCHVVIVE